MTAARFLLTGASALAGRHTIERLLPTHDEVHAVGSTVIDGPHTGIRPTRSTKRPAGSPSQRPQSKKT
jgi:hypothetical protein